jgi:hypothetical protein
VTERPILFSAAMVRALIDGRKTQTRRICKWQPGDADKVFQLADGNWHVCGPHGDHMSPFDVPYSTGDRLWVKETWKPGSWRDDGRVAIDYRATPELVNTPWVHLPEKVDWPDLWEKWTNELRANGSIPDRRGHHKWEPGQSPLKWRSGRFMPRWASRLTLIVTDVRVERLQDISEVDALAEGVDRIHYPDTGDWGWPQQAFRDLWNSIIGADAWDANPYVVAIGFTVKHGNIDR